MTKSVFVGIDLGGTNIRLACSGEDGVFLSEDTFPTFCAEQGKSFYDYLNGLIGSFVNSLSPEYDVKAICMGIPAIYFNGTLVANPNIRDFEPQRIINGFTSRGIPFYIYNDVKCAAVGEMWKGAARGTSDFIFVNTGTGVSMAAVAGGTLINGQNNASGEIAYWITEAGSTTGYADGRAPFEEQFSGRWIAEAMRGVLDEKNVTAKRVFEEYARGNLRVKAVLDRLLSNFATVLANACILLNPGMLVLGGGMAEALDLGYFDSYLKKVAPFPPVLVRSALGGAAGLYGAVKLAIMNTGIDNRECCRI